MSDELSEFGSDALRELRARLRSPVLGSILLASAFLRWESLFILATVGAGEKGLTQAARHAPSWGETLVYPILITAAYLFVVRPLVPVIWEVSERAKVEAAAWSNGRLGRTLVDEAEYQRTRMRASAFDGLSRALVRGMIERIPTELRPGHDAFSVAHGSTVHVTDNTFCEMTPRGTLRAFQHKGAHTQVEFVLESLGEGWWLVAIQGAVTELQPDAPRVLLATGQQVASTSPATEGSPAYAEWVPVGGDHRQLFRLELRRHRGPDAAKVT